MALAPDPPRRLVVNADDFGRSHSINLAVIQAHQQGVLTSASLMVNEAASDEAVELAHANPRLGVGLHLTLLCGRSALKPTEIPGLVNDHCQFSDSPVAAGLRYFFSTNLRRQLRHEIEGQFQKFQNTGLPLDHVNGHLNIHLHPTILGLLCSRDASWQIRHLRVTSDRFWLNSHIARGRWFYRISHAAIFNLLSCYARPILSKRGIRHTRAVFGLLENGQVHEDYILRLLHRLPGGDSELYSHPSFDEFRHEFDALVSVRVRDTIRQLGIQLVRYQDL